MSTPSPVGPGLDEGVGNLAQFNALLTATLEQLRQGEGDLSEEGQALERLEKEGIASVSSLADALGEHRDSLESTGDEAAEQVDALAGLAGTAADERLGEAQDRLGQARSGLEEDLEGAATSLEMASADLTAAGFAPASETLADLAADLEQQQAEMGQAFDGLDEGLDAAEGDVDGAGAQAQSAGDTFDSAIQGEQNAAAQAGALGEYATGAYVSGLQAAIDAARGQTEAAYAEFSDDVLMATSDMVNDARQSLGDEAARVDEDGQEVEGEVVDLLGGSTAALLEELDQTESTLAAGADIVAEAGQLIPELAWAQGIVAQVAELLEALQA